MSGCEHVRCQHVGESRQAMLMAPPLSQVITVSNQQTRTTMLAMVCTYCGVVKILRHYKLVMALSIYTFVKPNFNARGSSAQSRDKKIAQC